jgi:hypothetical protein
MEEECAKRVFTARDQLAGLLVTPKLPEPLPTKLGELARLADELEGQVQERLEACRSVRETQLKGVQEAIGNVRAVCLPADWLGTGLSTHLAGIGDTLRRTQGKLIDSLRKEADRMQEEIGALSDDPFVWAVKWVRRSDSVGAQLEKMKDRVAEFEAQSAALASWVSVNQELFAAAILSTKIGATDPAPAHELTQLLGKTRERFSTARWEPLGAAAAFRGALRPISQTLQGLLYSQARVYFGELEQLRQRFTQLLPGTPAPAFEAGNGEKRKARSGYDAFAVLYGWALSGFNDAFARAKQLKGRGHVWADPRKRKRSWNELSGNLERLLGMGGSVLGIDHVMKVGEQLGELVRGFTGTNTGVFDTPEAALDFDVLRERFLRGEVVIRIEPRQ